MKTKPSDCEKVAISKNGCQKAKEKRWTRQTIGLLFPISNFSNSETRWLNENTTLVPSCSTINSTLDENQPSQFLIEEERCETGKSTDEEMMEIEETDENQPRKHKSFMKVEKRKRNRNPLTYVNKSYKGVNKMDLEQRSYDETLRLFDGSTRKVTRSVVKVLDEFESSAEVTGSREEVPAKIKKEVPKIDCGDDETNMNKNQQKLRFERGQIVWGYFRGWWPALIIEPEDVGMVQSKNESHFVFWIGSKQISEIPADKINLFSERLYMIVNVFNQPESSAKKYNPCRTAVEMLNQKLQDPEMALTGQWVEEKLFSSKDKVDTVRFFPYPSQIQDTLEQLKKSHEIANAKKTQYFKKELKEKKEPKMKKEKNVNKEKKAKEEIPVVNLVSFGADQLELKDQKVGAIGWSKEPDQQMWPVMIVDYRDGDMKEPKFKNQWVVRYGDYSVTQVDIESILKFRNGFDMVMEIDKEQLTVKEYLKKMDNLNKITKKEKTFESAVLQATKDYCEQRGLDTKNWTLDNVVAWLNFNQNLDQCEVVPRYSDVIREKLYLKKTRTFECPRKSIIEESDMLRNVLKKLNDINDMCLICMKVSTNYKSHPFFEGQICEHCLDGYLPTLHQFGTDGKFVFCSLCGGMGTVVVCSTSTCPFVFCVGCLKCLIIPKDFDRVMMQDPWNCFFCNKNQTYKKLVVQPRDNWRLNRDKILNNFPREMCPVLNADGSKKKARVLSLFDGISTGYLALKGLKIEVEVYYASEIDPDAIKVSHMNFPTEITRIGDVRKIDEKMLREMAPIDLLLGGSPCNDLSMANPKRKGLNDPTGTGILFYEYVRIKDLVEKVNQGHEFFWLYENVASMSTESRERISECLGRKPDVIDSAQYSAQHRPRLYWNNFPDGISSYSSPDLQEMLDPHCGRTALVKKMRTITANRNSLRKGRKFDLKPIMMNGVPDVLRTSELERIFGFPPHYTDANINLCTRHKLIGKSWSVPTIRALMYPLCEFFKTSDD